MKGKARNANKLIFAAIALVVALALAGMATYAWYTLSTNPEISSLTFSVDGGTAIELSLNGVDFTGSINFQNKLGDDFQLVPVSTTDGTNWYACKYDVDGDVLQNRIEDTDFEAHDRAQYEYMEFPYGSANYTVGDDETARITTTVGNGLAYYAYVDIYMRTTEEAATVYLSTVGSKDYEGDESEDNHHGTYVLCYKDAASQDSDESTSETTAGSGETEATTSAGEETEVPAPAIAQTAASSKKQLTASSQGAETCARVGIKILGEVGEEDGEETLTLSSDLTTNYANSQATAEADRLADNFVIFEPNADVRSLVNKDEEEYNADQYIASSKTTAATTGKATYEAQSYTYDNMTYSSLDGYYFPTFPVTKLANSSYKYSYIQTSTGKLSDEFTAWDGTECVFPASQLIVGLRSTWNTSAGSTSADDTDSIDNAGGDDNGSIDGGDDSGTTDGSNSGTNAAVNFNPADIDSSLVDTFGKFWDATGLYEYLYNGKETQSNPYLPTYTGLALPSKTISTDTIAQGTSSGFEDNSVSIVNLEKDQVVKVRLYFWIEGQDVDCWNDVSNTNFLVNIEFSGYVTED